MGYINGNPNWESVPAWAQWFAIDKNGSRFFYKHKPQIVNDMAWGAAGPIVHIGDVDPGWASDHWTESLVSKVQLGGVDSADQLSRRRVTLFIEFSGEPNDDTLLARRVGEALMVRLGAAWKLKMDGPEGWPSGNQFTPGDGWVKGIKIAVGTTKLAEIDGSEPGYKLKVHGGERGNQD